MLEDILAIVPLGYSWRLCSAADGPNLIVVDHSGNRSRQKRHRVLFASSDREGSTMVPISHQPMCRPTLHVWWSVLPHVCSKCGNLYDFAGLICTQHGAVGSHRRSASLRLFTDISAHAGIYQTGAPRAQPEKISSLRLIR